MGSLSRNNPNNVSPVEVLICSKQHSTFATLLPYSLGSVRVDNIAKDFTVLL